MKAAVLTNYGDPLEIWDIEWEELKFGQVKVRMYSAGICGAQLQEISGFKGNHLPRLMGHEGCGEVIEIGHGVKTVKIGDKVVLHWRKGDGIESDFPEWNHENGRNTAGLCTTWSEETVVSENRVTRVPPDTSVDLCVLLGCSLSTALGTLEQEAKLKMGESLLIIGAGGLGMSLFHASDLFHPSYTVIVDRTPKIITGFKRPYSSYFGDWEEQTTQRFDVVIDTTGHSGALEAAVERLNPSGRLIMVGQPKDSFSVKGGHRLFSGEGVTIKATQGGGFRPHLDIPRYIEVNPDLKGIISHRLPLAKINDGLELVRKGEAGRVLIEM